MAYAAHVDAGERYDEVPYPSRSFARSHPESLGSIATLFGLTPADVGTARVLELGCASGGNLMAMAQSRPQGRFVGVDASGDQVAHGRAQLEDLGWSHVELVQADLAAWSVAPINSR